MKTLLLTLLSFSLFGNAYSQETYEVTTLGSMYSMEQIQSAIDNANMCGYFYQDETRTLYFKDGSIVELKKASDIQNLDSSCVTQVYANHQEQVWEIAPNGHLIKRMVANPTK